jgi:RNA-directed DNA polymerase
VAVNRRIPVGYINRKRSLSRPERGIPQGGVISPLLQLSNLCLTEVDRMLERAKETTRNGEYTYVEHARFADDLVILIDAHPRHNWLLGE